MLSIQSRIGTFVQIMSALKKEKNHNWFNEPFTVSRHLPVYLDLYGFIFEIYRHTVYSGGLQFINRACRRFEGLVAQGKSPTVELLRDWGMFNATVGELADILMSHKLLAAASVLLPGMSYYLYSKYGMAVGMA